MSAPERSSVGRRAGYLVAIVVDAVLLYLINGWPGWDVVPLLTEDTTRVLGWVNASIIAGVVTNAVYLVSDPPRLKALGDLVVNGIGLYALVRIWQVFPFDFPDDGSVPWDLIARTVLVVAIFGTIIALIVAVVRLVTGRRR
ncbi:MULTISPECIES: hypothetical protein [Rhodococcus]|uniref:Uncharacterized protein n=1 Tax=Rhodococcus rhodochrous TaxID=1829 RepID=A0AAW4XAK7_RHORH|nr:MULTISPECIES: hypothetical protein [Rhodococcus]MCD2109914.1 hypothetical protein [Rhodococcus rhodochrous]QHG84110.1 hypothetical protein D1O33_20765 [Rhodococcus rhodochrous]QOH56145.1 hypothetical protein C6Y44_09385 [Rhodococcus rhodochrous]WAL48207.1 hypothetical protein OQN32_09130 [Rhodococcus pyridinivorans]